MISGMTHPSASRSLQLSDIDYTADEGSETGRAVIMGSLSVISTALDNAVLLYLAAARLAAMRGGNATLEVVLDPTLL